VRFRRIARVEALSPPVLIALLLACLVLSALFSGTETALMSVNRYQLRTQARAGNRSAQIATQLLERPDRLIGLILLGNNLVNNLAATLVAVLVIALFGDQWLALGAGLLTFVMLIFCEVGPKTVGALYPRRLALLAAPAYLVLGVVLWPLVWLVNRVTNAALRLVGVRVDPAGQETALTQDELRTVVAESAQLIPQRHQQMLIGILDLERITVADIMIPRQEIAGIDLEDDWDTIARQIAETPHTRLAVYRGDIDDLVGLLHLRRVAQALARGSLDKAMLERLAREREPYFVPESTRLNVQLLNFQRERRRLAFVVDEYGSIQGMVTLEDLLGEIVGEFTRPDARALPRGPERDADGSWRVDASSSVRALNRLLGWRLPSDGPRTLNGLLLAHFGEIPAPGATAEIDAWRFEVLEVDDSSVLTVRARPIEAPATEPGGR
jgi:Mg2+/Co2+ transporter CorB